MAHPLDAVIAFFVTTVTGLATTGTNVFRQRVYDLEDGVLPALLIYMGDDIAIGENGRTNMAYIDGDVEIRIEIKAKDSTDLDTALLDIRAEIETALNAAFSARPASVQDYWQIGMTEPETSESDTRKGTAVLTYNAMYRRAQ